MVKVNWTVQAIEDLINIADFIGKDSRKFAKITVGNIRERVQTLKMFPKSGKMVPEFDMAEIRELVYGNYRIIYYIHSEKVIDILTIHHAAKKLDL